MAASLDRAKAAFDACVRGVFSRLDYFAGYWCRVVGQNADGSLELQPDDARLPPLSGMPIRYGVPGVTAKVPPGARCLLEFAGGDPTKPFVSTWEPGTVVEIVLAGGTQLVARKGDKAKADTGMAAWITAVDAFLAAVVAGPVTAPAAALAQTAHEAKPADFGVIDEGAAKVKA
jgi:hypothetical protein